MNEKREREVRSGKKNEGKKKGKERNEWGEKIHTSKGASSKFKVVEFCHRESVSVNSRSCFRAKE
jgi:hypothetical protein